MRFQLYSDLHGEFYAGNPPSINKVQGVDNLILAGDICKAEKIKNVLPFFKDISDKFENTYYVLGNHEFYNDSFDRAYDRIHSYFAKNNLNNIHLLKPGIIKHCEDVVIMGDTLWTDCNGDDPITKLEIQRGMNDYHIVRIGDNYRKLNPDDTYKAHKNALVQFRHDLQKYSDKKVVLVTHHAMSHKSVGEKYKDDYYMNGGYTSNLDQFILDHPNIAVHVHGHMHSSNNYSIGTTRVFSNPRGYPKSKIADGYIFENPDFNENLVIEV